MQYGHLRTTGVSEPYFPFANNLGWQRFKNKTALNQRGLFPGYHFDDFPDLTESFINQEKKKKQIQDEILSNHFKGLVLRDNSISNSLTENMSLVKDNTAKQIDNFHIQSSPRGYQWHIVDKCVWCSKDVFPAEKIRVANKTWHRSCLKCDQCWVKLNDATDVKVLFGKPYCSRCHHQILTSKMNFHDFTADELKRTNYLRGIGEESCFTAPSRNSVWNGYRRVEKCNRCITEVFPTEGLRIGDRTWHQQCLTCEQCWASLESLNNAKVFRDEVYCNRCYSKTILSKHRFGLHHLNHEYDIARQIHGIQKCYRCDEDAFPAEQIRLGDRAWHKWCVKCDNCRRPLDDSNLKLIDGEVYCTTCHEDFTNPLDRVSFLELDGNDNVMRTKAGEFENKAFLRKQNRWQHPFENSVGIPKCFRCKDDCLPGEQIRLANKVWHKRCLKCESCWKILDTYSDVKMLNGEMSCLKCYHKNYPIKKQISFADDIPKRNGSNIVKSKAEQFENKQGVKKNKWNEECERCGKNIFPSEQIYIGNRTWHKRCLKCEECWETLEEANIRLFHGTTYCKPCYTTNVRANYFQWMMPNMDPEFRRRNKFIDPRYFMEENEFWNNDATNCLYENKNALVKQNLMEKARLANEPEKNALEPVRETPSSFTDELLKASQKIMHPLSRKYLEEIENKSDPTEIDEKRTDGENVLVTIRKETSPSSVNDDATEISNYATVLSSTRRNWVEELGPVKRKTPIFEAWAEEEPQKSSFVDKHFRVPSYIDNHAGYVVRDESVPLTNIASLKQTFYDNLKGMKVKNSFDGGNRIVELDSNVIIDITKNSSSHFSKHEHENKDEDINKTDGVIVEEMQKIPEPLATYHVESREDVEIVSNKKQEVLKRNQVTVSAQIESTKSNSELYAKPNKVLQDRKLLPHDESISNQPDVYVKKESTLEKQKIKKKKSVTIKTPFEMEKEEEQKMPRVTGFCLTAENRFYNHIHEEERLQNKDVTFNFVGQFRENVQSKNTKSNNKKIDYDFVPRLELLNV